MLASQRGYIVKISDFIAIVALLVAGVGLYFSYDVHSNSQSEKEIESKLFTEITQEIGIKTLSVDELINRVSTKFSSNDREELSDQYLIKKAIYALMEKEILVFIHSKEKGLNIELRTHLPRGESKDTPSNIGKS